VTFGWSRGSQWRRWDPHIHTPSTLLANKYGDDWDAFDAAVNAAFPVVEAVGVTDYATLRGYREFRNRWLRGAYPAVKLIFPNVELRLTTQTKRGSGINVHLLFSTEEENHHEMIEAALSRLIYKDDGSDYRLVEADLIRLGRAVEPHQTDASGALRVGATQFKVELDALRIWRSEKWLKRNCIIAVAGGQGDGTSGLQDDDAFKAHRADIERLADVIFSSRPSDVAFWLGERASAAGPDAIAKGGPKPCLHGSDAHSIAKVFAPDMDRRCWLKGEATFETLRQAVLEPGERAFIGELPPTAPAAHDHINAIELREAPWVARARFDLNPGLIAIIGPKGSGKTALADFIARGADAFEGEQNSASFLQKAADHLGEATVTTTWGDGAQETRTLAVGDPWEEESIPRVRYLSQQFVERLCSGDALGSALVDEIESVIFRALDETDRLNASSFAELRDMHVGPLQHRRTRLEEEIRTTSAQLDVEHHLKQKLPSKVRQREEMVKALEALEKERKELLVKGKEDRVKRLADLEAKVAEAERRVATLKTRHQRGFELLSEIESERRRIAAAVEAWTDRFDVIGLQTEQWTAAGTWPAPALEELVRSKLKEIVKTINSEMYGSGDAAKPAEGSLAKLRALVEATKKELGIDQQREKKYAELTQQIQNAQREKERLIVEIGRIEKSGERVKRLRDVRRAAYAGVFASLQEEGAALALLYEPLRRRLEQEGDVLSKLEFFVHRRVDLADWAERGETLLDLRRKGPLQGHDKIAECARKGLLDAWRSGSPEEVAASMDAFISATGVGSAHDALKQDITLGQFVEWLFSTAHISVEYGLRYDGTELRHLSPGSRGVVLLLLYLAVDTWDRRPILADQPEENLDPQSVFDDLVGYFRQARRRRQVILVTHNANLVVNTDADQVIIASAARTTGQLPRFTYVAGPLEDPEIRNRVCQILEGGERAFRQRERRYGLGR